MLLIFTMFLSMAYVALFGRDENTAQNVQEQNNENVDQHLKINIGSEPPTLHPGLATDSVSNSVITQTFEGLTRIDLWGLTVNAAASVIKISDDQKTYRFTLRDAKWTNGDPVIAKDFEYAWKWLLDPNNESKSASQLYYIEGAKDYSEGKRSIDDVGVKALDEKTLEVTLVEPTPNFLELVALNTYFPINSKIAQKNPDWANEAGNDYITNGPFQLEEWVHNEKIVLKKNKNYWDSAIVRLDSITMFMEDDPYKELAMFENNEIDWAGSPMGYLPMDLVQELEYIDILNTKSIAGIYNYKLNTSVEPFNNENIRKAFALAINREEIVTNVTQVGQKPAMAFIPPVMAPENEKGYFKDNDVKEAKRLLQKGLDELGYLDVSELSSITLSIPSNLGDEKIARAIIEMWKENLGVDVTLEKQDRMSHTENMDYQVAKMEWVAKYKDPITLLEVYSEAENGDNMISWENAEFQSILDQTRKESDSGKRQQLLKEAEAVLIREMPVIPIFFKANNWVQNENLKNIVLSDYGQIQFKWAYFE
jgi:oligopeptide transport system substrate-binding protein